jgi:predicted outer membrane protein
MRRNGLLAGVVVVLTVIGGCSKTETKKAVSEQPAGHEQPVGTIGTAANVKSDGDFVQDMAMMNLAEIELSRLALGKTARPDIKSFAQRIIDDHGTAVNKLKSVVSAHPIEWPAQLDEKHRKTADELAKESDADFDRAYVKAMVDGHQDLAAKLESRLDLQSLADWNAAAAGRTQSHALPEPKVALRDVEVRPAKSDSEITMKINQWAAETYPDAQKHLDMARTLKIATKKGSTD